MSNELPSINVNVNAKLRAGAPGTPEDDVRRFLSELETAAESCQNVVTKPSNVQRPPTYLEPIARKYSFAPPRRPLYEVEPERMSAPAKILANLKRATQSVVNALSHRKS